MLDAPTTQHDRLAAASDAANHEAWTWIHAAYAAPIARLCQRSGLSPGEADEVVNDVLLRLARRLSAAPFKPQCMRLREWLAHITHQQVFEAQRLRAHHDLTSAAMRQIAEWLPGAHAPQADSESRQKLERHLWSVCLARVRAASSPRHWQIFEAYCFHEIPSPDVARTFNTTRFNVRMIRMRMVRRIRNQWARLAEEPIHPDDIPEL
jgi:RNA polymerase sigma factor (sigma-70 family)